MSGFVNNKRWGYWSIRFQFYTIFLLLLSMTAVGLDYLNLAFFARGWEYPVQMQWLLSKSYLLKFLWLFIVFPAAIIFVWWIYRAYSNLHRVTYQWRCRREMAIISWIVPLANLFVPYIIIDDLFRLTSTKLRIKHNKTIYRLWCFFWIMSHLGGVIMLKHLYNLNSIELLMSANKWLLCFYALVLITAALKIKITYDYLAIEKLFYRQVVLMGEVFLVPQVGAKF